MARKTTDNTTTRKPRGADGNTTTRKPRGADGKPVDNVHKLEPVNGKANVTNRGDSLQRQILAFEEQDARIEAIMEKARKDCAPFRDEQKAIRNAAAEEGTPKAVFGTVLRQRKLLRKVGEAATRLNDDQRDDYQVAMDLLGDFVLADWMGTPLGAQAAGESGAAGDAT